MLSAQVYDLIDTSSRLLAEHAPADADEARRSGPLMGTSADMAQGAADLKRFLREHLYRHARVVENTEAARRVVRDLYRACASDPHQLPAQYAARRSGQQAIVDYIAGMTDRFALREHARLFGAGRAGLNQAI